MFPDMFVVKAFKGFRWKGGVQGISLKGGAHRGGFIKGPSQGGVKNESNTRCRPKGGVLRLWAKKVAEIKWRP